MTTNAPTPNPLHRALRDWSSTYGAHLCPPGPDTYGEGMRDAKRRVAEIVTRSTATPDPLHRALRELVDAVDQSHASPDPALCSAMQEARVVLRRVRAAG